MGVQKKARDYFASLVARKKFYNDKKKYRELLKDNNQFALDDRNDIPIYYDSFCEAGNIDPHYFLQDIYMCRQVISYGERNHFDIGSRVDGFISHLLASGKIESVTLLDIRPLSIDYPGLKFIQTDATKLENIPDNSIKSISSLHAVEHFGLGRYGDSIDPFAWEKALQSMQRVLSRDGTLFLSAPIGGKERLCFNAHRVFSPFTIIETMRELKLVSFSYIQSYQVIESSPEDYLKKCSDYDCGLFVFKKEGLEADGR